MQRGKVAGLDSAHPAREVAATAIGEQAGELTHLLGEHAQVRAAGQQIVQVVAVGRRQVRGPGHPRDQMPRWRGCPVGRGAALLQVAHQQVRAAGVDEHTGGFGGARRYFEGPDAPDDVAGVMIGYPGQDKLVVGGRGVHRVRLHVHGTASHSGGSATTPSAIQKAADLIRALSITPLPDGTSAAFPLPGKLTVTAIAGGEGFSVTPDLCTLNVDIRTTPTFDSATAAQHLEQLVRQIDHDWPDTRPTLIQLDTRWPAYALDQHSPLRTALLTAAADNGVAIEPKIAGPSNIGNYLAGLHIPATAGFGAIYTGLHGTDERIRIDSIPAVHATYHAAVRTLLRG